MEKRDYQKALDSNDIFKYELFLDKYPYSDYQAEIYTALYRLAKGNADALLKLGRSHPDIMETYPVFKDACRLLYQEAGAKNTMEGWDDFLHAIEKIPPSSVGAYKEMVMEQKRLLAFASEKTAWEFVSANKLAYLCEKYLLAYPKGKHVQACRKLLIDMKIDAVFASGEYGELPPMEKTSMGMAAIGDNHTIVIAHNDTGYKLTVSYGGKAESKQLVLAPGKKGSLRLLNGRYRIVASVNSPTIINCAGEENLTGYSYGGRYYIATQYSNVPYISNIQEYKK
jgi:hypothetical protein